MKGVESLEHKTTQPPLAAVLFYAAHASVRVINHGRSLQQSLLDVRSIGFRGFPKGFSDQEDALIGAVRDLANYAMSHRLRGLVTLEVMRLEKPIASSWLQEFLALCLALLADESPKYLPYVLTHQAVESVTLNPPEKHASGFVNAILRRFLREKRDILQRLMSNERHRACYVNGMPWWWQKIVLEQYPDHAQAILAQCNGEPPMVLRVQHRRQSSSAMLEALRNEGWLDFDRQALINGSAICLDRAAPVQRLPGYGQGWFVVQDEAAQRAASLLDLSDGMRVLDACAAPGVKSTHILDLANVDLTAIDIDEVRLQRVRENLERLQLESSKVRLVCADVQEWAQSTAHPHSPGFDRILADLPCTASGIVRRHPEIRWLRREEDRFQMAKKQRAILKSLWPLLKPGGVMVIATCSLFMEEGALLLQRFLSQHPDAVLLPSPGVILPCFNLSGYTPDGFYYACLRKC